VRLYPTSKQRTVLAQWFGAARWTYNQCLHGAEKEQVPKKKKALRAYCINDAPHVRQKVSWLLETPYDVRDEAMNDLLKAYDTAFALLKKKHTRHFEMKPRTRKAASESIVIHAKHWKDTQRIFYAAAFKKAGAETTLRAAEPLPDAIAYDCRLQRTRLGHYYFCLLLPAEVKVAGTGSENQAPRILAIDPGVRTFLTGYDPLTGAFVEWGKGDMKRIERLTVHLDDLLSRTAKEPSARRRYAMRKAQQRMRLRIQRLVDEFHKKLVHWLVGHYDLILLPEYNSSNMVNTKTRGISRPSVRAMLTWAPYRFKQRLLIKARPSQVIIVDEAYTTMTCGACGHLNRAVGTDKVFRCPTCGACMPRDWNAARNVFVRFVSTSTWASSLPGLSLGSSLPALALPAWQTATSAQCMPQGVSNDTFVAH
jgi:putative transposase